MDIKIRNKFIEIKNCISDWFVIAKQLLLNNDHIKSLHGRLCAKNVSLI